MIYNTRNWSNYTTETQKEKKTCFNGHAGGKMWSLKSLIMLNCESKTSLHAVQCK